MKNKIQTTFILVVLFIITPLYAITAPTLFDRDSFVVTSVDYLARRSGIIGVYDSFPATGTRVLYTFNKIERNELSEVEKQLYDKVEAELKKESNFMNTEDGFSANLEIPVTLEASFYDTSDGSKLKNYELDEQYKDVAPWFDLKSQLTFGDEIYGYTQFAIKDRLKYSLDEERYKVNTNLDSFSLVINDGSDFETYQPFKIGLSVGDDNYNFQIGRNRLSAGSGITGNFFIGDNFSRQDYASISLYSSFINYTSTVTEFDQQSSSLGFEPVTFNGKHQYRVMNRMRVEILKNLSLDIYQGAIYQVDNINLRMLIPFMYVHNYFNFADNKVIGMNDESNNILGMQTKWVLNKGNELNFILTLDQVQLFESGSEFPQAYGILLNYKSSRPLKNGILDNSFEFVYTSPYLYLNQKYDVSEARENANYNYDHIYGNDYGDYDEVGYGGYYYGPDTIMLAYLINYDNLDKWTLGTDMTLRIQGTKGIDYSPSDTVYTDIIGTVVDSLIVGTPETIISVKPKGSIAISDYLTVGGYLSFSTIFNHYNDSSASPLFYVQGKLTASFNFL